MKILLDTDIGSDIDDAVCLAYLLAHPECELLGITTVTGQAQQRAEMASALCKLAGKDIPIYPGAQLPLIIEQSQPEAPQASGLKKLAHETEFPKGEAIEFLRRTIRQNPGEVTLFTIGPLTNIALLFSVDPEIPSLLKELVIMGGRFFDGQSITEWNIKVDPHAAAIVYRNAPKHNRSIGLDVTTKVNMMAADVWLKFAKYDLLRPVLDFAEIWFQHRTSITFHDPLAATTIFDNAICTFQSGRVEVDLTPGPSLGSTKWHPSHFEAQHSIATQVNPERFFEHYFSVFE